MPDLGKMVFATQTSRLVSGLIIIVPIIAIVYILFKYIAHTSWYFHMNPNIRGVLTIAIIAVPLLILAFVGKKIKDILYEKLSK